MSTTKIKIRQVKSSDLRALNQFLTEVDIPVDSFSGTISNLNPVNIPFRLVHSAFPLQLKFLSEVYVAVQDDEPVGFAGIIPDNKSKLRWKINQLFLKPDSYDAGKLLIDFLVNKFGADGVESFITEVDSTNIDAISLFKNGCNFRECSINHIFQLQISQNLFQKDHIQGLRDIKSSDNELIHDLYHEMLTVQTKMVLNKSKSDFGFGFTSVIKEQFSNINSKRWVLLNPDKQRAEAFIQVLTKDNKTFQVFILTSNPYTHLYSKLLKYVLSYVASKNNDSVLVINLYEAFQCYKDALDSLAEFNVAHESSCHLLVKDYWRPLKEPKMLSTPILIFPDGPSPACNGLQFKK